MSNVSFQTRGRPPRLRQPEPLYGLVQGIGWFSLALGAAELVAPDLLARTLGMRGKERLIQSYGAREMIAGFGILTARDPAPWLWGRLVGDVLDVATLATAPRDRRKSDNVAIAVAAVVGVALVDLVLAAGVSGRKKMIAAARPSYAGRNGFPRGGLARAWGAARDFDPPEGFRTPDDLASWI